jgi:hypothetical protein
MFEVFETHYKRDASDRENAKQDSLIPDLPGLAEFFKKYGGASFQNGLYRIMQPADLPRWQERIALAFPEFEDRVVCFGYDWAGSVFTLDIERLEEGQAGVLLFEPGTGEVLRISSNLSTFHNNGLIEFGEAALGICFYEAWRGTGGESPTYDYCIGYRVPLFLGGADNIANLEYFDIDVYWHIMGQLIQKTKELPPGTSVRMNIDD